MLDVMMPELMEATKDFYHMTGIKIVLYDESRRFLYSYPESMCRFCKTVRESDVLTARCREFDNVGFDMCEKTKKPYIYRCHMGLAEAITPICDGDRIIGYMMMGQILCDGARNQVERAVEAAVRETELSADRFLTGLGELRSVSNEFIRSALNVMAMCVCYLYSNKIIRSRDEDLTDRLRTYIENHYTEPLTVPMLCGMMYISKSKLYHLSVLAFGMGVTDYIRHKRIEKAKDLLLKTNRSVAQIGREVGFEDANYFTRIFKKEEGMTPKEYRNQSKG